MIDLRLLVLLAAVAAPARADLITACAPEIARYCDTVTQGRGRVSACLAGRLDQLGAACRPEVQTVMTSRMAPADMRVIFQPGFSKPVPASCAAAARTYCAGITAPGRVFACLYAYSDKVSGSCAAEARAAVK